MKKLVLFTALALLLTSCTPPVEGGPLVMEGEEIYRYENGCDTEGTYPEFTNYAWGDISYSLPWCWYAEEVESGYLQFGGQENSSYHLLMAPIERATVPIEFDGTLSFGENEYRYVVQGDFYYLLFAGNGSHAGFLIEIAGDPEENYYSTILSSLTYMNEDINSLSE